MIVRVIETKVLCLCLAALLACEALTGWVLTRVSGPSLPVLGGGRLVETILFLVIVSVWGEGISSIGLAPDKMIHGLKKGFLWSALFGLGVLLVFAILHAAHLSPLALIKMKLPRQDLSLVLFFIVGGLVAPVAEEVFFRGILYGFLRRWGILAALIGTTFIFVAAHFVSSRVPVTQIIGGILFAIAYEVGGNLMVPITIHVLGNLAIFSLSLVVP